MRPGAEFECPDWARFDTGGELGTGGTATATIDLGQLPHSDGEQGTRLVFAATAAVLARFGGSPARIVLCPADGGYEVHTVAVDETQTGRAYLAGIAAARGGAPNDSATPLPAVAVGGSGRRHQPEFPLLIELQAGARPRLRCHYRRDRIAETTANWFLHGVRLLLLALVGTPDDPLAAVDLVTKDHPAPVLPGDGAPVRLDGEHTLHELVARRAAERPDAVAVSDDRGTLSYRQLDDAANVIAQRLRLAGAGPSARVGVHLRRSSLLIATLLGVLKTGASYVPLVPGNPANRLDHVVDDADVRILVTDGRWPGSPPAHVLSVDENVLRERAPDVPAGGPDDEAYLIYTSGSTGKPKGVVITHRQVCSLLDSAHRYGFGFGPDDAWALFHTYAWDFSVWEIFGCLSTGGHLVIVPESTARDAYQLHTLLDERRVTVLNQTPSVFAQLAAADADRPRRLAVRLLIFSGEQLDMRLMLRWFERYPESSCRVVNMYGITETTVACTWQPVTEHAARTASRSVGFAIPGWQVDVVDERDRRVPPGVTGEILLGGPGIVDGYHRRPELTAARFLFDRDGRSGSRWYRTGDRGRVLPNGELEYLGRADDQVKVRGHRVELGEVRSEILTDPRVRAAAVVLARRGRGEGDARLDAYVVGAGVDQVALGERLRANLPDYMVPDTITELDALPVTGNGKLDPDRLPEPALRDAGAELLLGADEPVTELHRQVGRLWAQVLGTSVRLDDDLFLSGGNSLLAFTIVAEIRRAKLGKVSVQDIYRNRTVRGLADVLAARAAPAH